MYTQALIKPDGRSLTLYARQPLDTHMPVPSPFPDPLTATPHMRWHPLRGEWVTYAAYWQDDNDNPALAHFLKLLEERYPLLSNGD